MNIGGVANELHVPVMLQPVIEGLAIKADGVYLDGTFGRGGHSRAILDLLGPEGRLIAVDRDPEAIASADKNLIADRRFELVRGEIADLKEIADTRGLLGQVDGVLLDLGVSSPQLDDASRGFSFLRDGPLDMRMDPESGVSAARWLASVGEKELKRTLQQYGEEPFAGRIARAIIAARAEKAITRTGQLAEIVADAVPLKHSKKHPATKTFQAIRIKVNGELEQLTAGLEASLALLKRGGRLAVISFHSLEDRPVKRFMRNKSLVPAPYRGLPSIPDEMQPPLRLVGKAISASAAEVDINVRARSAHLRIAERL